MQRILKSLWSEIDGGVLSTEMILYGTLGVVGVSAGYGTVRDSVNSELDDVAKAIGSIDQSYYLSGTAGHCAWTAGSAFIDRADRVDYPSKCVTTAVPVYRPGVQYFHHPAPAAYPSSPAYVRPTVCADVFGPSAPAASGVVVPAQPYVTPAPGFMPAPVYAPVPGVSPAPGYFAPTGAPDSLPGAPAAVERKQPPRDAKPAADKKPEAKKKDGDKKDGDRKDGDKKRDADDDRREAHHAHRPHPHHPPHPAVVVGAPGLMPHVGPVAGHPVRVMVNPWATGGYPIVDVPEGYFSAPAGTIVGPPTFQMMAPGADGYFGCGTYCYQPPVAAAPAFAVATPPGRPAGAPAQIDLGFTQIGDDDLKNVEKFQTAKCLHVLGSHVTDVGIASIGSLQQLESLHVVGTRITNDGLKPLLKLKNLRFLHLIGTRVTDDGLKYVAAMKGLEEFDCRGSTVTPAGIDRLQRELPTLRIVR